MPAQSAASAVEGDGDVYYDGAENDGAYYTAKLTFFHDFPIKVWGACYIQIFRVHNTYSVGRLASVERFMLVIMMLGIHSGIIRTTGLCMI